MGFWHTGYMEFHEPTGLSWTFTPEPVLFTCAICRQQFDTSEKLLQHRFEAHAHRRPMLFVRGQELGATPYRITREVTSADFVAHHAVDARVNGESVPVETLGEVLAACTTDRTIVELANESVHADFELRFAIARSQDCAGVERCFESMVKMKRLDQRAIEEFISNARAFTTATTYLDGVCNYLYGVLGKERHPECSLPFDAYREKFELAAGALGDFDRPLALLIRALISFHFNHFDDVMSTIQAGPLYLAARRFHHLVSFGAEPLPLSMPIENSRSEGMLTDLEAERIIRWALANRDAVHTNERQMRESLLVDLVEFDRTKIKVLLAEHLVSIGALIEARNIARTMRNNSVTGLWAESIMARTTPEHAR